MTAKLIQKNLLKGTQEFEIVDDMLHVRIKKPFKEQMLTMELANLNPDPVINESSLDFYGRVKCAPLVSLYLNKPNPEAFNAFVDTLKRRATDEFNAFAGLRSSAQDSAPGGNVYEEPPEFDEAGQPDIAEIKRKVNVDEIATAIQMLEQYVEAEDVKPLISALAALQQDPQSEANLLQVLESFNGLGVSQGAVLTYAPYVSSLLSDDPYDR
ncbi:MAG: hypothetical protein QNJ69_06900 [Gammaproteobacteria bacterium]|nr:hypothetical protein [Gammaproteobacteria bacterium]